MEVRDHQNGLVTNILQNICTGERKLSLQTMSARVDFFGGVELSL